MTAQLNWNTRIGKQQTANFNNTGRQSNVLWFLCWPVQLFLTLTQLHPAPNTAYKRSIPYEAQL